MGVAGLLIITGLRYIDGLGFQGLCPLQAAQGGLPLVKQRLKLLPGLVDKLPGLGPLLRCQLAHATQKRGELSFFAQHRDPQAFQRLGGGYLLNLLYKARAQVGHLFPHVHAHSPFLCGHKKSPRSHTWDVGHKPRVTTQIPHRLL
jgi:hypothetical protein